VIIFVATVPENTKFVDSLKGEGRHILHPFYAFDTEEGKEILAQLSTPPLKFTNPWQTILRKDIFCILNSDLILYDFDNLPEEGRYLTMAASLNKPVLGVSETLKSAPVYFSGSIVAIVKPKQVLPMLPFIEEHGAFIDLPTIVGNERETILPDTGMPT